MTIASGPLQNRALFLVLEEEFGLAGEESTDLSCVPGLGHGDELVTHWLQSTAVFGDSIFAP